MGPFLIILGTRGVTYSAGEGSFSCPSCGPQPYKQKRVLSELLADDDLPN